MTSISMLSTEAVKEKIDKYKWKLQNGNTKNKVQQQMTDLKKMYATVFNSFK